MLNYPFSIKKREQGFSAENDVRAYLEKQGLIFVTANYYSHFGEIDLIMQDKDYLIFIEVRMRKSATLLSALETIDKRKQQRIRKTAICYLQANRLLDKTNCRFDIVTVEKGEINWLKNAF